MPKVEDLIPPERTGSEASQQAVDAMMELLSVMWSGENWGRTVVGCKNALAEALDDLIALAGDPPPQGP